MTMARVMPSASLSATSRSLTLLGFIAAASGFAINRLWTQLPVEGLTHYAGIGAAAAVCSILLSRISRMRMATACVLVWFGALIWFSGPISILATALLACAAIGLGSLFERTPHSVPLSAQAIVGMAILAAIVGWLIMFPVHHRIAYLVALGGIVVARRKAIAGAIRMMPPTWSAAVDGSPAMAWFAMMLVGLASTACWLPTFQFDDLSYHLKLPWQLQTLGYYRLDAASHVWALAPWGGDVLQSIVQLVAGAESRGALNALWLSLSASLLWRLCAASGLHPALRWCGVALYASLPLTTGLLTTMQAETPGTAALLALAVMIQDRPDEPSLRRLCIVAALAAFLLALKASFALMLLPMGLWLLWNWRGRIAWKGLPFACLLALVLGGSSYVYAWHISGNPVLPLFNAWFMSPYFPPVNFQGAPWNTGFSLALPWNMVFDTHSYVEARDGAAGFTIVFLSGAFLACLFLREKRALALVALACFILPLTQVQYLRYAYPAMPLLLPAMLAGLAMAWKHRQYLAACIVLSAFNFAYYANSKASLARGALYLRVKEGEDAVLYRFAPDRLVARHLRESAGKDFVALYPQPGSVFAAELGGNSLVTNWYDWHLARLRAIALADPSGKQWGRILDLTGATHVVKRSGEWTPALQTALDSRLAELEMKVGPIELWRLPGSHRPSTFMEERNIARRMWLTKPALSPTGHAADGSR